MKEVTLKMKQSQITRYHIIMKTVERKMTIAEAAGILGLSERQVKRLKKGVKEEGAAFLIHKNKNRPSSRAATQETKAKITELYKSEKYKGSNFVHYTELLKEYENINLSYSTVRKTLKEAGIESPKKRRRYKPHRRRKRKAQEGVLIQMDATPYEWFGGRIKFALHGAIDDATGKICGAYMTKNECLQGYMETMRQIIERKGVPASIYVDRHTIFRSPKGDKLTVEEQLSGKLINDTQFGRAMKELGINMIYARSPQAKGRVERLWETLQSRLLIELRIHNINTVEEANCFLESYIQRFNEQFAVLPEKSESAYAPLTLDLDLVLCVKEHRVADNGGVFSFHGKLLKITSGDVPNKAKVQVVASPSKGILTLYKGKVDNVSPYVKPKKVQKPKQERKKYNPPDSHYYKHGKPKNSFITSDLVDSEIRKILEDIFLSKYVG